MLSSSGKGKSWAIVSSILGISTFNCEYEMVHEENGLRSTVGFYVYVIVKTTIHWHHYIELMFSNKCELVVSMQAHEAKMQTLKSILESVDKY